MKTLHIDIVSDIACPWCAIGYARLEQAMNSMEGELAFEVEWHAFELNPDKASDGEPILQALSRKYGRSIEEMEAAQRNMMEIAQGLELNFSKMQERYTHNTFDAHRLVKWAGEQNRQTDMKMALFDAYFGHAANISDTQVLIGCAESIGLNGAEAKAVLDSDAFDGAVRADEALYQQSGVSAVPAFIINKRHLISGAQEPETLVNAFREVASRGADA
ncbi:DsbA family oxidoreductase [uncultured Halopseudomonas sp.]|uniref:DsbA family oxidoreductase n=1 Tax=uncultured Halopseudomonas sp. TaxID=2901193 RepID=UPI0030EB1D06|tara:strand:+ start:13269 stop:13922 length:654 start_codon:yes stop_codon:yes gene_type:complete